MPRLFLSFRKLLSYTVLALFSCLMMHVPSATAQNDTLQTDKMADSLETIRRLVLDAYGGQKLAALKSISIQSDRRLAYQGTNFSTDFNEFVEDRYYFQLDLRGQRGSSERYIQQNGNIYHDRTTTTPKGIARISYPLNRVTYAEAEDFYRRFGTVFRISDTLLAYAFVTQKEDVALIEPTLYRDVPYTNISLTLPESATPLIVSIDKQSGHIMQVTRMSGSRELIYLFRNHTQQSGITFARESQVFIDGELFDYEVERKVKANRVRSSAFEVEPSLVLYTPPPPGEMTVNEITPSIDHVGQFISHTTFIQSDGYVIGIGSDDGFKERYEAFKAENHGAGSLRYLVVSHDHEFERSGIEDALALGATIIVSKTLENFVAEQDQKFQGSVKFVQSGDRIGPLQLFEISTVHTDALLISYLFEDKIILEDDHYRPLYEGNPRYLFATTTSLVSQVEALDLEVEGLLSSHGARLEPWPILEDITNQQQTQDCWLNRRICKDRDW